MYRFTYDDENDVNIVTKSFEDKPSKKDIKELLTDTDLFFHKRETNQLMLAEGDYVYFAACDDGEDLGVFGFYACLEYIEPK